MWTSSSAWRASALTPPGRMAAQTDATATTGSPTASATSRPPARLAANCWSACCHASPSPTAARWMGASCGCAATCAPTRFISAHGNILMEPNDQYLCIVQAPAAPTAIAGGNVYLPFEGDTTLAIILSKAFLLADDTKITDPTDHPADQGRLTIATTRRHPPDRAWRRPARFIGAGRLSAYVSSVALWPGCRPRARERVAPAHRAGARRCR